MDKLKNWIQENIHKMNVDEPNAAAWDRLESNLAKPVESDLLKNHIATNKSKLEIESPDMQSWNEISNSITTKKRTYVQHIKRRIIYISAACIIIIIGLGVLRYMNVGQINQDKEIAKKTSLKNNDQISDTTDVESNKNKIIATQPLPDQSPKQGIKHRNMVIASSKPAKSSFRIMGDTTEFVADRFKVKKRAPVEYLLKKLPGVYVDSRGNITRQGKEKSESLPPEVAQMQKDYDQLIAGQIAYTKSLAVYGESASYFEEFRNDFKILDKKEKELRKSVAQNGLRENSIDDLAMIYQQKLTVLKKLQNEINKTSNRNKNLTDTIPSYISL